MWFIRKRRLTLFFVPTMPVSCFTCASPLQNRTAMRAYGLHLAAGTLSREHMSDILTLISTTRLPPTLNSHTNVAVLLYQIN